MKAANEVRLMAAQETSAQHSRNSGASGSVGFSIGTDGLLFTASASGNRGKGDGEEVRQVNSHVDAGNKLSVASGGDTTISGAVLRARQVELDVGTSGQGNLNIASQQDTSTYQILDSRGQISLKAISFLKTILSGSNRKYPAEKPEEDR
ncbi:hemagglutinin repeat-containing protein [Herbaspirillum huttiense]|uniref:Hemagglutinin repeat-containing protein n=1 Tax=Herbaspirillum huttiense subsp. lycopersici TaxID=3074428 RepID=A0ABU2EMG2_9BURK|nr:hemagglutinin repeat-containing protein [Herbaspirillum huttiense]MDR9849346.1 hemagglutinin repeat-containing protein [Herbaspirillum huttiense SE1]